MRWDNKKAEYKCNYSKIENSSAPACLIVLIQLHFVHEHVVTIIRLRSLFSLYRALVTLFFRVIIIISANKYCRYHRFSCVLSVNFPSR